MGSLKIQFIGGKRHEKLIHRRELLKGRRRLAKKREMFLRGLEDDTPMHTINLAITLAVILIY